MSPRARLLLWDYPRGSAAWEVLSLLLVLLLFAVPAAFWADPMAGAR